MRPPTTAKFAAPLLLTALLLPACSSSSDAAHDTEAGPRNPDPSPSSTPSATPSPTSTPTPAPTHEPTPAPSESPPLPAEDGTDVDACRQADCEIYVEGADIFLDPRFGFSAIGVEPDGRNNAVLIGATRPKLRDVIALIEGTGYVSFVNGVTLTVVAIGDTGAVIRLEPHATEPEDTVVGGGESQLHYDN